MELSQPGHIRGAWPASGLAALGSGAHPPCALRVVSMTPLCNEQPLRGKEGKGGGGMELLSLGGISEHTDLFLCNDIDFVSALPFPSRLFQIAFLPLPCLYSLVHVRINSASSPSLTSLLPSEYLCHLHGSVPLFIQSCQRSYHFSREAFHNFYSSCSSHTSGKVSFGNLVLYEAYKTPLCQGAQSCT